MTDLNNTEDYRAQLRSLLDEAYEIGHAKDMASRVLSVEEMIKGSSKENYEHIIYIQKQRVLKGIPVWIDKVENVFNQLGINFRKFTADYSTLKPPTIKTMSLYTRFDLAYTVFKKIYEDEEYFKTFLDEAAVSRISTEEQGIIYKGGTILYKNYSHTFHNPNYISLFNFLWGSRKIISKSQGIVERGNLKSKSQIQNSTGITYENLPKMAVNIRKEVFNKGIPIKLRLGNAIYLELTTN